jgi:hypothetical protein
MAAHLKARPEPRIPSFGNVNATLKTPCFHNYGKPSLDFVCSYFFVDTRRFTL